MTTKYDYRCPHCGRIAFRAYLAPNTKLACRCAKCGKMLTFESSHVLVLTPEQMAQNFYERLAPDYSYKTREGPALDWKDVPDNNKNLMIAVCVEILSKNDKQKVKIITEDKETNR